MRSIQVLGTKVTGWQAIPADAQDFRRVALGAANSFGKGPSIGKVPKQAGRSAG